MLETLKDVIYPAGRDRLVSAARRAGAQGARPGGKPGLARHAGRPALARHLREEPGTTIQEEFDR
ncbi:hypothetical protein ACPCA8_11680 [Streptomyces capoamus]|uniref:DUF2795 domain-containing protein n=1 Tax=Streptomyces capoamus TaxID=68183 RepID=UPI003C2F1139